MDKSPDAYRTISEVATDLDVPQHVLRFWETRFAQIKPLKRGGGRRYYRPDDIDLVKGIKALLYGTGFTIKGVQRILKEQGVKHVQTIGRTGQAPAPGAPPQRPVVQDDGDDAVLASPLKARVEPPVPAPSIREQKPKPGSAEDLAALIAPALRAPRRASPRRVSQLGLFGDETEVEVSTPQAMARMLPSAWQGAPVSAHARAKLESALADLEECTRLIGTAMIVSKGDEP